jgi:hypothetical protein
LAALVDQSLLANSRNGPIGIKSSVHQVTSFKHGVIFQKNPLNIFPPTCFHPYLYVESHGKELSLSVAYMNNPKTLLFSDYLSSISWSSPLKVLIRKRILAAGAAHKGFSYANKHSCSTVFFHITQRLKNSFKIV